MYTGVVLEFLNMGGSEIMLILAVVLLLFGGKKLPELARGLGKGIRDFKDASEGVKREIHRNINAMDIDDEIKATDAAYPVSGTAAYDANNAVHVDPSAPTATVAETPVAAEAHVAPVAEVHVTPAATEIHVTPAAAHVTPVVETHVTPVAETPAAETHASTAPSEIEKNKI
ncbi:twin-arginine translocase TatA/TatE family subunit [Pedobacter cryoconitis]|uniref:Sec-independent protein translocase protein TatA n=1 Tax=Pedobacter cryoconitis TaxID=188932 RepID=A0A327SWU8_9SPHI|nr:twin-arginine translocase TatA/TatE family subunit [Pedobacter cryoconitis]RAJ33418.1 Tat protein translocase TatB subunit [Pedobacter cryoconitis]